MHGNGNDSSADGEGFRAVRTLNDAAMHTLCHQLKVFWTVVVLDRIFMMHGLLIGQRPPKFLRHDVAMLMDVT